MTNHRVSNKGSLVGATNEPGIDYPSGASA